MVLPQYISYKCNRLNCTLNFINKFILFKQSLISLHKYESLQIMEFDCHSVWTIPVTIRGSSMTCYSASDGQAVLLSGLGLNYSHRSLQLPVRVNHGLMNYLLKMTSAEITLKLWQRLIHTLHSMDP